MPRRLIIGILVMLIIGIVGGTVAFVVQRLRQGGSGSTSSGEQGTLEPATAGPQQIANPTGDDDGDGLKNVDEVLWGTNSRVADSDSDGTPDGAEVTANRNPTVAGPSDALPANFQPGRDQRPLAEAPLKADQFFAANLDLSGPKENLTQAYEGRFSTAERNEDTLTQFLQAQPVITQLPAINQGALTIAQQSGPRTLALYLDTIDSPSVLSDQLALSRALNTLYSSNDTSGIEALRTPLRLYQEDLQRLVVPPEAVELHKLLLGYSALRDATLQQITAWPTDRVKALLGLRQLNASTAQYMPLLQQEISRLRTLSSQS